MEDLRKIQRLRVASAFKNSSNEDNLEKAGHGHIGEVRDWGGKKYKKQPNGKWLEVSESHEMTKEEHHYKSTRLMSDKMLTPEGSQEGSDMHHLGLKHEKIAKKLSDKEHTDEEVGLGGQDFISKWGTKGYGARAAALDEIGLSPGQIKKYVDFDFDEMPEKIQSKLKEELQKSEEILSYMKDNMNKSMLSSSTPGFETVTDHGKVVDVNDIEKSNYNNGKRYIRKYINNDGHWVYVYGSKPTQSFSHKDFTRLQELRSQRKQLMFDMEQEAEPEGGSIADSYGIRLNKIDQEIEKIKSSVPVIPAEEVGEKADYMDRQLHGLSKSESEFITFLKSLPTIEEQEILTKSKAGLTAKKVTIHRKDGTPYIAVRWVNEHGEAPKIEHPKYKHEKEFEGESDEDKISNIVNSESKPIDKQRALISMGVRDKHTLDHLSGTQYKDSQHYLKNEAGVQDWKDYTTNDLLPSSPSEGGTKITSDILSTVVSDIQDKLGSKKAFETQQQLKAELIKKYNVTIDDKWDGYEDNISMLLDGDLGLRAVMGYGNGGVGKTYTFDKIAQEREMIEYDKELDMENGSEEYDYVKIGGKIGSREMQKAMFYHRNKLLVFDDCDSMWDDEGLINVLKNTLDTSGKGKCQWAQRIPGKDGEEDIPSIFTFTGRMIFITNKTKKELYEAGAGPITESRAASTDLSMNMEQTIERLERILPGVTLKDENREPMADVTDEDKKQALQAFKSVAQYARVDQLNTRVLTGIIAKARFQRRRKGEYNQEDLAKVALSQFGLI